MNTFKVRCPNCGGSLAVKSKSLNLSINITCPICQTSSPLSAYTQITNQPQQEQTEYPGGDDETQIYTKENYIVGQLKILDSTIPPLKLKEGRNIIGRKANSSTADIQIPLQLEERSRMSREHLIVDVVKANHKGMEHRLSLYKPQVNETCLNGEKLVGSDCFILKHGDVITLPDIKLVFEIPDEEATVIQ